MASTKAESEDPSNGIIRLSGRWNGRRTMRVRNGYVHRVTLCEAYEHGPDRRRRLEHMEDAKMDRLFRLRGVASSPISVDRR